MKFALLVLSILSQHLCALETYIIDQHSENKMQVMVDVLNLQKTLVADFTSPELPPHLAENGFLARQMDIGYLESILYATDGKIIAVYDGESMVGYLLLIHPQEFFDWAEGRKFDAHLSLEDLAAFFKGKKALYLDQIAVSSNYAKHGIGTLMVDVAKKLGPDALMTDILHHPFVNHASHFFFTKKGFSSLGIIDIDYGPGYIFKQVKVMLWSPT